MIRKSLLLSFSVVILMFVVSACGEALPAVPTLTPDLPSATPTASEPHPTSTPSLIPSSTQPPIPIPETGAAPEIIEPVNAGQIVELAKLGKGTILSNLISAPEGMPTYSPDGLWMAIPTSAGIYIYDTVTLEELHRIPVGTSFIFSPDGGLLAAGGRGAVSLWDPATGDRMGELPGNIEDYYGVLAFSPDGSLLSIGSWHREIAIWSLESIERLFTFPGDRLQFSPDGELAVVIVYGENRVHLYETRGGTEVNKWNVRNAGFAPGGQLWLEDDKTVRLVYIDRNLVTAPFSGIHPSFSADGSLMSLFANGQISLYDHQKGQRTQILEGSYVQSDGVLFSPDGQTLAGAVYSLHTPTCTEMDGLDRSLVLWRAGDGSIIAGMKHQDPSDWMGYSVDGSLLAAVQMENVQIINTTDGSIVKRIDGFTNPVEGMVLSPDGVTLAAVHAAGEYTLRLWNLETGRVERALQGQDSFSVSNVEVSYSPDEKYIAVGGDLWDLEVGEHMTEVEQTIGTKTSCWSSDVAFAPQGFTLATGCFDGQLDLWAMPEGKHLKRIAGYSSWVEGLAYSPNGDRLAAIYGVPDYLVQVWQLPEGKPAFTLEGGHFTRVAYSWDGSTLATVMAKKEYDQYGWPAGIVQLWDAADGEELAQLEVEDAISIAFSPDSQILATGSLDGTLRLWEIAGGRMLMEANGHFGQIQRLVFTPDGTSLVSGSQDGTIIRWGIPDPSFPEPVIWAKVHSIG